MARPAILDEKEVESLYRKHGSCAKVAEATGWNEQTIRYTLKRIGVPRNGRATRHVTEARNQEIMRLYRCGIKQSSIATLFSVTRQRVWQIIERNLKKESADVQENL